MADVEPYETWTKEELADELRDRQLPTSGNKDELVARLEANDADEGTEADDGGAVESGVTETGAIARRTADGATVVAPGKGGDVQSSIGPDGYNEPEKEELEPFVVPPVPSNVELDAFLDANPEAERIPPTLLPPVFQDATIATPGMPELIDAPNQPVTEPADAATWRERDLAARGPETQHEREAHEREQREAAVRANTTAVKENTVATKANTNA